MRACGYRRDKRARHYRRARARSRKRIASAWCKIVGEDVPSSSVRSETSPIGGASTEERDLKNKPAVRREAAVHQTPRDVRLDARRAVVAEVHALQFALVEAERRPHLVDAEARRARDVLRVCGRCEEGQESS